jgi:hypothetical protein
MSSFDLEHHHITVNGLRVEFTTFEVHPSRLLVNAPGVAQFSVKSLDDARDVVRSLFEWAAQQ